MLGSFRAGLQRSDSTRTFSAPTPFGVPKQHSSTVEPVTYVRCSCCSVTRHTAREHPTEAKVHSPYHPQFGEAVIVRRRLVTHNVEMAVILQPDGSLACLPAWMLAESAAQHRICGSPTISLAFLQSLRVEIDALLASLPSDSEMGDERHAAKFQNTRSKQLGLFEQIQPEIVVTPVQQQQLTMLVEALLSEIASALATGEVGNDQDHR